MIESIQFTNYKALRNTTLPLAPFTLLLGPNGSGKSSVLQALREIVKVANVSANPDGMTGIGNWSAHLRSVTAEDRDAAVAVELRLRLVEDSFLVRICPHPPTNTLMRSIRHVSGTTTSAQIDNVLDWLRRMQTFALDANLISQPVHVNSGPMNPTGSGLAAVLDDLKDNHPERWVALLDEMRQWLPEYNHIQFDKPAQGQKAITLRTEKGGHRIAATDLSQGTLLALALLTLAYLPNPPSLIGLEEIDRGLHPRLLRHLQDALYRLSYPESCGESRPPIQVIATTHSPYLLDLYRDHPDEVVLAEKKGLEVEMKRLTDIEHYGDILGDSPLSEVWYSGVLGGASVKP